MAPLFETVFDLVETSDGADFVLISAGRATGSDGADDLVSGHERDGPLHDEHVGRHAGEHGLVSLRGFGCFGTRHPERECHQRLSDRDIDMSAVRALGFYSRPRL